ncbi:MAG TPA: M48 family metallopeptidase [Thermoanaerobaculia bacterium]|nr:M48 family metallopeptidase [Thermoanaerobaculia bacterium]
MAAVQFTQIHPRAFAHPSDVRATSAFERLPLFPELLKTISKLGIEERFRAHHMHHSVLLSSHQFPSLNRMVHEVAERLSVPPPKTYLTRQGGANAFVFGRNTHSIVLTTGLVDLMTERELQGIIAHEMGHILCQHMLYMGVGLALTSHAVPFLKKIPGLEETVAGLFFSWFRAAEYSADRAALLILEDPEPLAQALSRLAGVPRKYEAEFDLRLFSEQVADYAEEATWWSKIATFGMDLFLSHPEPAKRVNAILQWSESDAYKAILSGRYLTKFEAEALDDAILIEGFRSCPLCLTPVGQAPVCPNTRCGLEQDPQRQQLCPNEHVAGIDWRFCIVCGNALTQGARCSGTPDR